MILIRPERQAAVRKRMCGA